MPNDMNWFTLEFLAQVVAIVATFVALSMLFHYRVEIVHFIMSRLPARPVADAGMDAVYIPVSRTGMEHHTSEPAGIGMGTVAQGAAPDIDAANAGMDDDSYKPPRISTHLSDAEMIVLLAAQRGKDGKHRFSANAIHALIGGDRNTVLARVKELRSGTPAVFTPLTPEQQEFRTQLQLDQH
jgi:hypothetical protein